MANLREEIMEGQHKANLIAKQIQLIKEELSDTAFETFKEDLKMQLENIFRNKTNRFN